MGPPVTGMRFPGLCSAPAPSGTPEFDLKHHGWSQPNIQPLQTISFIEDISPFRHNTFYQATAHPSLSFLYKRRGRAAPGLGVPGPVDLFSPPLPPGPCFLSLAQGRPLEGPSQDSYELIHLPGTFEKIGSNKQHRFPPRRTNGGLEHFLHIAPWCVCFVYGVQGKISFETRI